MTNNTITFIFIHVLQLLVLLIGTGFNKVVTTFANNILAQCCTFQTLLSM